MEIWSFDRCKCFEIDWNLAQHQSQSWKISLQLSGISHICHHQDFEIDWNLAQHWSKSWKISLQLARIADICHHQDFDIDWNLAQHWSKSWKISLQLLGISNLSPPSWEVKAKMELKNIILKQPEINQSEMTQNQSLLQRGRVQNLKAITNTQQSIAWILAVKVQFKESKSISQ